MTDIRANRFVGEQNVWEVRTSDPSTTEEGEMWLRSDLAPDTNQLATLRFDDGASILDIPIYATGSSGSSVSEALRIETPSGTGFIPTLPKTDATFPQLRFQHNGGVTAFHDVPELASAFFDVQNLTTNSPVTEGSNLNANFDLENTGSQDGTQTVELLDFSGTVVDSSSETVTSGTLETGKQLTWATASGDAGTGDITVQSDNDLATAAVEIQSSSAIPDSAIHYWPHSAGSGTTLSDDIGSLSGTINGSSWVSGTWEDNFALSHDGTDDEVDMGDPNLDLTTDDWTALITIEPESLSSDGVFWSTSWAHNIILKTNANSEIEIVKFTSGVGSSEYLFSSVKSTNTKYRVAVKMQQGTEFALFVNGTKEDSLSSWSDPDSANRTHAFGYRGDGLAYFNGQTDDAILCNSALTDQEIQDDYNGQPWS